MVELLSNFWRPILAVVLLVLDPLRMIGGMVLGLVARPWWIVLPGAVVVSVVLEFVYVKVWSHMGSFNSVFAGSLVALFAAWIGLSWRGRAPRLISGGGGNV